MVAEGVRTPQLLFREQRAELIMPNLCLSVTCIRFEHLSFVILNIEFVCRVRGLIQNTEGLFARTDVPWRELVEEIN